VSVPPRRGPGGGPGGGRARGGLRPIYYDGSAGIGVTLRDDKGSTLPANISIDYSKARFGIGVGASITREYVPTYYPNQGDGQIDRLVYTGRRHITVSVPFTLKDVKLP